MIRLLGFAAAADTVVVRTIVPIYQSEISPPNHVRFFHMFFRFDAFTCNDV